MRKLLSCSLICLLVVSLAGCAQKGVDQKDTSPAAENKTIVLSTTTSTKDSGLLDNAILPAFEKKTGYQVKVLSQGTGQALKTGELGDCDVVLVHARASEDKFVADGFGVNRKDVMYNDFVIVGPAGDPSEIKGLAAIDAFQNIARAKKGEFISRGDESGTHKKEKELWEKAGVKTEGNWYLAVGKGMGDALVMTDEKQGYTLADRGTYASMKDKLKLVVLVEGDSLLLNPYGVIAVNPARHAGVNHKGAMDFINFITSQEGKDIINGYKVNGQQLFFAR